MALDLLWRATVGFMAKSELAAGVVHEMPR